jgi:hypothetical protein
MPGNYLQFSHDLFLPHPIKLKLATKFTEALAASLNKYVKVKVELSLCIINYAPWHDVCGSGSIASTFLT